MGGSHQLFRVYFFLFSERRWMSESINLVLSVPVMIYKLVQFHRFSSPSSYARGYILTHTQQKIRSDKFYFAPVFPTLENRKTELKNNFKLRVGFWHYERGVKPTQDLRLYGSGPVLVRPKDKCKVRL